MLYTSPHVNQGGNDVAMPWQQSVVALLTRLEVAPVQVDPTRVNSSVQTM